MWTWFSPSARARAGAWHAPAGRTGQGRGQAMQPGPGIGRSGVQDITRGTDHVGQRAGLEG
ncbi:hypothetical protein RAA17_19945 [Komagataeibacter rhaeticus]|nr:hypothetical protein [Komagataeibacter rhaeticus]